MSLSVGFIGSGMMASSLMDSIVAKGIVTSPSSISCSDISEIARTNAMNKGYYATPSNMEVCQRSKDVIILAVKPNFIETVCKDVVALSNDNDVTIISIAAGIALSKLEIYLPGRRVIRVMPNTPCLVGEAASGYSLGSHTTEHDQHLVRDIFNSVGTVVEVKESLLDGVTGLSGSGPAYVFQFIEALSDGGVRVGLPREVATKLAAQTVKGAAEMVLKTGKHPGLLKDSVTSPGGTTICGLDKLEKGGLRTATISAIKAATKRAMQLGGVPDDAIESKHNL